MAWTPRRIPPAIVLPANSRPGCPCDPAPTHPTRFARGRRRVDDRDRGDVNLDAALPQYRPDVFVRLAPMPHFSGGVVPRIDVDEGADRAAGDGECQMKIVDDVAGRPAVNPLGQAVERDAVMGAELDLLVLGRKPMEVGVVDDVIQRQEPPEIAGGIGESPVADVGNLQRLVDALVGDPADSGAVRGTDDGNGLFHGQLQVHKALHKAMSPGRVGVGVKKSGVLAAG